MCPFERVGTQTRTPVPFVELALPAMTKLLLGAQDIGGSTRGVVASLRRFQNVLYAEASCRRTARRGTRELACTCEVERALCTQAGQWWP